MNVNRFRNAEGRITDSMSQGYSSRLNDDCFYFQLSKDEKEVIEQSIEYFKDLIADRYDRRILMMIGDGCSALGIIYILICMIQGKASLLNICIGVFVSSVFSSLLEPSYRATITDLLTKEEFSKASGLVSLAGSARYLVAPVIAGLLLSVSDVKLLLMNFHFN